MNQMMTPKEGDYIRFKSSFMIVDTYKSVQKGEFGKVLKVDYIADGTDTYIVHLLLAIENQYLPIKTSKGVLVLGYNWTVHQDNCEIIPATKAMEILYGK